MSEYTEQQLDTNPRTPTMPDPITARVEPPSPSEQTMREARRIAESVTDSDWKAIDPQEMIGRIAEAIAAKQAEIERWKREAMAAREAFAKHDGYHTPTGPCPHCIAADRWKAARAANGATP